MFDVLNTSVHYTFNTTFNMVCIVESNGVSQLSSYRLMILSQCTKFILDLHQTRKCGSQCDTSIQLQCPWWSSSSLIICYKPSLWEGIKAQIQQSILLLLTLKLMTFPIIFHIHIHIFHTQLHILFQQVTVSRRLFAAQLVVN